MKVIVTVKARAREVKIKQIDEGHLKVWVTAPPIGGKANEALRTVLADYYCVPKSSVRIIIGKTHTEKLVEIQTT